MFLTLFRFCRF